MDHRTLEERQIPERYLLGRLSPEEAELFEQHLLYCPRCQERVESTEAMVDGLRTVAGEDAATASRLGVLAWLARRGRAVRWSLAAALLLAFLVPGLILHRRIDDLHSALAEARGPRPATLLSLAAQRGTPPSSARRGARAARRTANAPAADVSATSATNRPPTS